MHGIGGAKSIPRAQSASGAGNGDIDRKPIQSSEKDGQGLDSTLETLSEGLGQQLRYQQNRREWWRR